MGFDENLSAIHAYLCADGYVIKNPETQEHKYYRVGFRNTNLVLLKDFQKRFKNHFRIEPRLVEGQRCEIGSKEIYELLTKKFGSFYSWKWKIPKLNEKLIKIWLKAYFDCEGWVICKRHQNRHIGADCVNEYGIKQIKDALDKLNIKSRVKKRNDRKIFSLKIYGKDNLIKFNKKIKFLHPLKKEKLKEAIEDFVNYYWDFPIENNKLRRFTKKVLREKVRINKNNGIVRIISNKGLNLIKLRKELKRLFNIESKLNKRVNGIGTLYFELNVNKQLEVKKMIKNNLINIKQKKKWLKLKK